MAIDIIARGMAATALNNQSDIEVVQSTGDSTSSVMSQNAVTEELAALTESVDSKADSDTVYTQEEVNNIVATLKKNSMQVVTVLPTTGEEGIIYLVGSASPYEMYIYESSAWIDLGSTDIDLSNYVTKDDIATSKQAGLVKPVEKTSEMTQSVGVDSDGVLWAVAGGTDLTYATNNEIDYLFLTLSEGLEYTLLTDGSYSVTSIGICTDTAIVIPPIYNDLPVTSIGESAFKNCYRLTSVTIPDSVTSIGESAFKNCYRLTSVTIPDSVTSISYYAFENCTSLASITIPDSVTSIRLAAFEYCYKLIEVYNLSSLSISAGSRDNGAVAHFAKNVYTATSGSSKLNTTDDGYIFYEDGNTVYLMGYTGTDTVLTLPDKYNGKSYKIYQYAFAYSKLTSITIPDGVTSIGYNAFENCTSLASITIPDSVTSIGNYAFAYCTSLTNVTIGNGVTSIGNYAFSGCTSLTSVTIGSSVTSIGNYAFNGCTSLASITIPDSVTSIGNYAFSGCTSLTSITIPDSVTSIGGSAFNGCTSLASITIPDSVTSIGNYAFSGCTSLASITIPDSVTSIGNYAFSGCTSLASITIPDSVTSIGNYAFYKCTSLTSVTFTNTNGWWYSSSSSASSGTSISSTDLADTSTAAKYLTSTYSSYYWKRS